MQLKVNIGDINEALAQASLTKDKLSHTALGNVYLRASKKDSNRGFAYVYSTNLRSETLVKIPADITIEGETILNPAQMLQGLIGRPREESVEIINQKESNGSSKMVVKYGRSRFHLNTPIGVESMTNSVKKMPLTDKSKATITGSTLGEIYRRGVFCIPSQSTGRNSYNLSALYITGSEEGIVAYASDGNIAVKIKIAGESSQLGKYMIPVESLAPINTLLGKRKEDKIELIPQTASSTPGSGPSRLYFKAGDVVYGTALLTGGLDQLKGIIEGVKPKHQFRISRAELSSAIERAGGFADKKTIGLRMLIKPDSLEIKMGNTDGENNDILDIEKLSTMPDSLKLAANMDYLANIASSSKSEQLEFGISGPLDPIVITDSNESVESKYVLMPMRI